MNPLRVVSFEGRRSSEMQSLIARHGGVGTRAPAMREVPLSATPAAIELVERMQSGTVDLLVLLTGVGTSALQKAVAPLVDENSFVSLLRKVPLLARGPKPVAVLKKWGLSATWQAPSPHTWRQVIATLDTGFGPVAGRRVAVQEYGVPNPALYQALDERGATPLPVPVYHWLPPEDDGPLRDGLSGVAAGVFDVALFTSANQVFSVFAAAEKQGILAGVRTGLANLVVASIGPMCSEALAAHQIRVDVEPPLSKMGHLVRQALVDAPAILETRRASR